MNMRNVSVLPAINTVINCLAGKGALEEIISARPVRRNVRVTSAVKPC